MTKDEYIAEIYAIAITLLKNRDGRILDILNILGNGQIKQIDLITLMSVRDKHSNYTMDNFILTQGRLLEEDKLKEIYFKYYDVKLSYMDNYENQKYNYMVEKANINSDSPNIE